MAVGNFQIKYDFAAAVALGLVQGVSPLGAFGPVTGVPASTETDMNPLALPDTPLPSNAGESLEILSDNAADTGIPMRVTALGAGGVMLEPFTITLLGTTVVPIPGAISRIISVTNISPTVAFIGNLTIRGAGVGTVFVLVRSNEQRSHLGGGSVPLNYKAIFKSLIVSMRQSGGPNTEAVIRLRVKPFGHTVWGVMFGFSLQRDGDNNINFVNEYPEEIPGPFDYKLTITTSDAGTDATGIINGLLFDSGVIGG